MKIAKVIGHMVSTIKTPSHRGGKLMVVQPIDQDERVHSEPFVAIDCAQAGLGDIVLIVEEGGSAREVMKKPDGAVDAVIVGIVDYID